MSGAEADAGPVGRATLLASLVAGVASGGVVYGLQRLYLRYLGAAVANGAPTYGLAAWVGMTVVLGVVFAAVARSRARAGRSTTGYGLAYGIVLAVFVGLLAVPVAVTASTQWEFPYTQVGVGALAGFALYGLVLGSVFGKRVNRRPLRPTFIIGRTRSTVLASLVAGVVAAGVLAAAAPYHLVYFALLVDAGGSVPVGAAVFVAVAVLLGSGFASLPARRVERDDAGSGLKLGVIYGGVLAVVGGAVVISRLLGAATAYAPAPPTGGVLGGYLLFGAALGVGYAAAEGDGEALPTFIRGRAVPVVGGTLVGGGAAAAYVFLAKPQPHYFLGLSYLGVRPSWRLGVGVWFVLALLLGVAFVPFGARAVEARIGVGRGAVVGATYGAVLAGALGVFVVPGLIRARGYPIDVPSTQPTVLAYVVFGLVFGGVYALFRRGRLARERLPTSPAVGTTGQRAVVFGSLFGGAAGGLVAHHTVGEVAMLFMGALVGSPGSVGTGWAVWLGLSVLLGTVFAVTVGPRLDDYSRSVDEFADHEADVERAVGGSLEAAPVTTTAAMAGFVYGVAVAAAVGAIGIPLAVNTVSTYGMLVPTLQPYFLLAFVVYGLVMGLSYGVVREF